MSERDPERDPLAPIIEGFDCAGIVAPCSYHCEPFFTDGENGGTLLDGTTVHDILAAKVRLSWDLTVLTPERYAALTQALSSGDTLDTVEARAFDATRNRIMLAKFHVARPTVRTVYNFGQMYVLPRSALTLEESALISAFSVTPPRKLSYELGDALDLTGLTVTYYDKSDNAADITADCDITPADGELLLTPGSVQISVSYDGATLSSFSASVAGGEIIVNTDWFRIYRPEQVTWDKRGILYIFCDGNMPNFERGDAPWYREWKDVITRVLFSKSVTSIGDNSLVFCTSVRSVSIPDSIKSIGKFAFGYCSDLQTLTIPNSVTSIGEEAFYSVSSVKNIIIPDSVTSIGKSAFGRWFGLTSVTIPDSVITLGESAFEHCEYLTNATIGDGVTSIGNKTFAYCYKLGNVTIGNSVRSIGEQAFVYCAQITSITIPNSVTSIGNHAFNGCKRLSSITIPDSVKTIMPNAFFNCSGLIDVTIGDGVTNIGNGAFGGCSAVTSVTIGDSVTTIGMLAFGDCTRLTDVYYGGTEAQWEAITINSGNDPLLNANIHYNGADWWTLENGVLRISVDGAMPDFEDESPPWEARKDSITSVILEDGATSIGAAAFVGYANLRDAEIPDSVTRIGHDAFRGTGLTSVTIPHGVTEIETATFQASALASITIPDSVTQIGGHAFHLCTDLSDVYYSGSQSQWEAIAIDGYNDPLRSATIHYNSSGPT